MAKKGASPTKTPESSETETEPEVEMTHQQYEDSIAFTFGKVKKQSGPANKAKSAAEMRKRLIVGFFVLAEYVFPMYVHPLALVLVNTHIVASIHFEGYHIKMKSFEDTVAYRILRVTLSFLAFFYFMPTIGAFERKIVEASGFSAKENPILFAVLYDYHDKISLVIVCFIFLLLLCAWRQRNLRFQLRKAIGLLLFVTYFSGIAAVNCYCFVMGGRWWLYFALLSVAVNDSAAYFAGRFFGKHHLIGLSPNKTIEGFLGGLIGNVFVTILMASKFLEGDFFQCAPGRLNTGLFEDWTCPDGTSPVYHPQEYQLPFAFMGYTSVTVKPAVIYTTIYAIYASLVAPFFGFFASGFKRAVGIKDFANSLPGHGGFIDRMDCISIMSYLNYFFLTTVILPHQTHVDETVAATDQLLDQEKLMVANSIATRLNLPLLS